MKINWRKRSEDGKTVIADVGNYIQLRLFLNSKKKYTLYLHIRKWKEDGCKENKLCQAQEVAGFKVQSEEEAKAAAEKWFKNFVVDIIGFANMSITDILGKD